MQQYKKIKDLSKNTFNLWNGFLFRHRDFLFWDFPFWDFLFWDFLFWDFRYFKDTVLICGKVKSKLS
jgi:hypothetical protein